jgi:arylsulfatase A-like enzyme
MIRPAVRSFSRCAAAAISVVGALGCSPSEGPGAAADTERPDVVLILIDTLRPDHLGLYGYERDTAPFLSTLARESTVFRRAFSTSSWTAPATASVFTGLYPNRHGVWMGFRAQNNSMDDALEAGETSLELVALPAVPTLAEHLKFGGYRTFGVAANINVGSELGFDRGFHEFEKLHQRPAEELVETALGWRAQMDAERPFFLYIHLNDVHKPNEPHAPWYQEREGELEDLVARYDSEISYTDEWIERLLEGLELDDDTLLVIVSDHGEEFMDHGNTGHKYSLYGELNRVLMIVRPPGDVPAGEVEVNVSLVDVLPTVLDAAGLEWDRDGPGRSLLPLLGAGSPEALAAFEERTLFAHRIQGKSELPLYERPVLWAAIRGRWKYLRDDFAGVSELFDMHADPTEQDDRLAREEAVAAELASSLLDFENGTVRLEGKAVEVTLDEALMEDLNQLGYAGHDD